MSAGRIPVNADQPPGQQVSQLERHGQRRHHNLPLGTRSGQEEAQGVHVFPQQVLVSADDDQRPAAQDAEDGVLRKGVVFEEPESPEPRLPPLLLLRAGAAVAIVSGSRVGVRGARGTVGHLVDAQQPEGRASRQDRRRVEVR